MTTKYLGALSTAVLLVASVGFAQSKATQERQNKSTDQTAQSTNQTPMQETQTKKKETPAQTTRSKHVTVIGQVKEYQPGKKLEVSVPHGREHRFDLDEKNTTVNGAENLKVGETVKVSEMMMKGHKTITVEPYTKTGAAEADGNAANAKTVIGKVTELNPGKDIKLKERNGKTQTFDLSKANATVNPNIKVGEMVRVKEWTENGQTMVRVEPRRTAQSDGTSHYHKK